MIGYGWPIAMSLGLASFVDLSDRYLVFWLVGDVAAGGYALATEFARQPLWFVMTAVSAAALPLAARAYERGGDASAGGVLAQHLNLFLLASLPVVALEVIYADRLVGLLLGAGYREIGTAIMPLAALAVFLNGWRSFYLDFSVHLWNRPRFLVLMWLVIALSNLILNLVLIPTAGVVGAAYATLLAHALGIGYFLLAVPRSRVLYWHGPDLAKIAFALAAFIGAMRLWPAGDVWFLPACLVSGALYLCILLVLRTSGLALEARGVRGRG
jgi:O-antigen/teichoic acid export membrane protein